MLSGQHNRGYLPHYKSEGATYFVTFRLEGTLPRQVLDQFRAERAAIIRQAASATRELSPDDVQRIRELFSERIDSYLDAGRGDCWLRRPEIARLVCGALKHFEGERYDLHPWVVMPNHVHALLTPRGTHTLSRILHSWKSFTATGANRLIGRGDGAFWQTESYDHVVRSERELSAYGEYIVNNPVSAGLCARPHEWPYSSAHASPRVVSAQGN